LTLDGRYVILNKDSFHRRICVNKILVTVALIGALLILGGLGFGYIPGPWWLTAWVRLALTWSILILLVLLVFWRRLPDRPLREEEYR
jgi:hypothetical protein